MSRVNLLRENLSDNEVALITSRPNIFYYSNFTSEDAMLLISQDKAILITDSRYTIQAKQQASSFEIRDIKSGYDKILSEFKENCVLYEEDSLSVSRYHKIKEFLPQLIFGNDKIKSTRMVKDIGEIKKIRNAEEIGDAAFSHILDFIKVGKTEMEIALEIEFFMRQNGATGLSFETIAASGIRSSMPHGVATDKVIENGDFLTLDFGCIFEGYCSDMTRTVVVGKCNDMQKEIYDIVLSAQKSAILELKKGKKCCDIDKVAREIIKNAGYGDCFGHGLGHGVGIEIHEAPSLSPKSNTVLKTGHVVTVEPGIYIEDFGGVRIEDLLVITDDGIENLTHSDKELLIIS